MLVSSAIIFLFLSSIAYALAASVAAAAAATGSTGAGTARAADGFAVVKIRRDEIYAIKLINDTPHDAAVTLTIDGLSVFAFSENAKYTHWVVPHKQTLTVPGWHRTNKVSDSFVVTEYAKSAVAEALSARPQTRYATVLSGGSDCAAELVLSGPGLVRLMRAVDPQAPHQVPEAVVAALDLLRAGCQPTGWGCKRPAPAYTFMEEPRKKPTRVSPVSAARSTASEDGAETAASKGIPAMTAFCTSSNDARPLTIRTVSRRGSRPDSRA